MEDRLGHVDLHVALWIDLLVERLRALSFRDGGKL
jgi:hypothetical protein